MSARFIYRRPYAAGTSDTPRTPVQHGKKRPASQTADAMRPLGLSPATSRLSRRELQSTSKSNAASTSTATAEHVALSAEDIQGDQIKFFRLERSTQATAILVTSSLLGFCGLSDDLPALRLGILTYLLWAYGEWVVHK